MRNPEVSVVLPVRDGAATLGRAIRSLVRQTFGAFEAIVVDDGSRDDTPAVLREWEKRDPRVRGLHTGPAGIVAALRRGMAEARAPLVARMDADDVCRPERLEAQTAFLRRTGLSGCGSQVRMVPESRVTERGAEYAEWVNAMTDWDAVRANLFVECPLAHPTFLFRADALREAGGYRDRGWPEDYDLLLRLWRAGHRFAAAPQALLDWNQAGARLSRTHPAYSLAAFCACRVHHLRKSLLAGRDGVAIWGAGPTGKRLALECLRQGVSVRGFLEVNPRKVGQTIHGAPVRAAESAPAFRNALHLGAVARAAGREAVRSAARRVGLEEGADFVAVA